MRKYIILLIIAVCFSGCSNNSIPQQTNSDEEKHSQIINNNEEEIFQFQSNNDEKMFYDFDMFLNITPLDFIEYLYSNPIDRDMKFEEETSNIFSTKDINEFVTKYYNIWYDEMTAIYENLKSQLNDEARKILEESQTAWEEVERSAKLWHHIFHVSKGRGTGDSALVITQSIDIIRKRTFLLAEYTYWLTGEFNFTYK